MNLKIKPLVVANWKMNPQTLAEAKLLFNSLKKGIKNIKGVEVIICPPFVWLPLLIGKPSRQGVKLGAQDCFWQEKGAFTGEVSPAMLKDFGCQYVIIGHSERRALGETDEMINKKLKAALKTKLKPILCIGETEEERKAGKIEKVLKNQLKNLPRAGGSLSNLLIIAYEPVWAIGTGRACEIPEAKVARLFIRKIVKRIPILYGGSVNSQNAKDYIEKADFQGLLVGEASLDAKEFVKLVKSIDLISK